MNAAWCGDIAFHMGPLECMTGRRIGISRKEEKTTQNLDYKKC